MFCFATFAVISAVAITTKEPTITVVMLLLLLWLHFQEAQ